MLLSFYKIICDYYNNINIVIPKISAAVCSYNAYSGLFLLSTVSFTEREHENGYFTAFVWTLDTQKDNNYINIAEMEAVLSPEEL